MRTRSLRSNIAISGFKIRQKLFGVTALIFAVFSSISALSEPDLNVTYISKYQDHFWSPRLQYLPSLLPDTQPFSKENELIRSYLWSFAAHEKLANQLMTKDDLDKIREQTRNFSDLLNKTTSLLMDEHLDDPSLIQRLRQFLKYTLEKISFLMRNKAINHAQTRLGPTERIALRGALQRLIELAYMSQQASNRSRHSDLTIDVIEELKILNHLAASQSQIGEFSSAKGRLTSQEREIHHGDLRLAGRLTIQILNQPAVVEGFRNAHALESFKQMTRAISAQLKVLSTANGSDQDLIGFLEGSVRLKIPGAWFDAPDTCQELLR